MSEIGIIGLPVTAIQQSAAPPVWGVDDVGRPVPCRVMPTRRCPIDGCTGQPCARFDTDDPARWTQESHRWARHHAGRRLPCWVCGGPCRIDDEPS